MANTLSIFPDNSLGSDSSGRRFIYNGNTPKDEAPSKSNAKAGTKHRRVNPLMMIFAILAIAFIAVFFIWNKITVTHLLGDINKMQIEYQKIVGKNEILRAEVNQKSRLERIEKIAQAELGLTYPKEKPVLFELDN
jgi:cell division protein FtsL